MRVPLSAAYAGFLGLGRSHFLKLGLGGRVGDHSVQNVELGAQTPHLAGGGRDRSIAA